MWGFGGRYYWGRKERGGEVKGIVVMFAWFSSEDKHVKNYIDLYSSLGWNSLVCHSQFFNVFFPDKATSLATDILIELVKELKVRPCPVVFASFSGGPKACTYKVLQIIEGKCESHVNLDECRLVLDSVSGHIYDSTPVDFTTDLGTRFVLNPAVIKMSRPPMIASWIANGIKSSVDALFLRNFESQRAEYWQTLYSSVGMGAPYLILCSEDDNISPCQTVCNFAQRLESLGGDVILVKWSSSAHVGHYRHHPEEYKAAVTELLGKAAKIYSRKTQQLEKQNMGIGGQNKISEPLGYLRKAVASSNQSFQKIALDLNDHFMVPTSVEYHEGNVGSVQDERNERLIPLSSPPKINAHGVLGQILFDACVPKNIEDWDLRSSSSSSSASSRRHAHFNPIKCMCRSRL